MKIFCVLVSILYTLFPVDLLPDIIPILGWLDDAALWGFVIWWFFIRQAAREADSWPGGQDRYYRAEGGAFRDGSERSSSSEGAAPETGKKTPHQILGIDPFASPDVIKKAYRELAAKYHPDKVAHLGEEFQKMAEIRFKEIQEAYQSLTEKE